MTKGEGRDPAPEGAGPRWHHAFETLRDAPRAGSASVSEGRAASLLERLLAGLPPDVPNGPKDVPPTPYALGLSPDQRAAHDRFLEEGVALVLGPAGGGEDELVLAALEGLALADRTACVVLPDVSSREALAARWAAACRGAASSDRVSAEAPAAPEASELAGLRAPAARRRAWRRVTRRLAESEALATDRSRSLDAWERGLEVPGQDRPLDPLALARRQRAEAPRLGFLPDAVRTPEPPPLDDAEFVELLELNARLDLRAVEAVGALPPPGGLPEPELLEELARELREVPEARGNVPGAARRASAPERLLNELRQVIEVITSWPGWVRRVAVDALRGGRARERWQELERLHRATERAAAETPRLEARHGPRLPAGRPLETSERIARRLAETLRKRGPLSRILARWAPRARAFVREARVASGRPRRADHFLALALVAQRARFRAALRARWDRQVVTEGGPTVPELGGAPEERAAPWVHLIRRALAFVVAELEPLEARLVRAGFLPDAAPPLPVEGPAEEHLDARVHRLETVALPALRAELALRDAERARARHAEGARNFDVADPAELVREMARAWNALDPLAYAICLDECRRRHAERARLGRRTELLSRLETRAPRLAHAIANGTFAPPAPLVELSLARAFRHRYADGALLRSGSRTIPRLTRTLAATREDARRRARRAFAAEMAAREKAPRVRFLTLAEALGDTHSEELHDALFLLHAERMPPESVRLLASARTALVKASCLPPATGGGDPFLAAASGPVALLAAREDLRPARLAGNRRMRSALVRLGLPLAGASLRPACARAGQPAVRTVRLPEWSRRGLAPADVIARELCAWVLAILDTLPSARTRRACVVPGAEDVARKLRARLDRAAREGLLARPVLVDGDPEGPLGRENDLLLLCPDVGALPALGSDPEAALARLVGTTRDTVFVLHATDPAGGPLREDPRRGFLSRAQALELAAAPSEVFEDDAPELEALAVRLRASGFRVVAGPAVRDLRIDAVVLGREGRGLGLHVLRPHRPAAEELRAREVLDELLLAEEAVRELSLVALARDPESVLRDVHGWLEACGVRPAAPAREAPEAGMEGDALHAAAARALIDLSAALGRPPTGEEGVEAETARLARRAARWRALLPAAEEDPGPERPPAGPPPGPSHLRGRDAPLPPGSPPPGGARPGETPWAPGPSTLGGRPKPIDPDPSPASRRTSSDAASRRLLSVARPPTPGSGESAARDPFVTPEAFRPRAGASAVPDSLRPSIERANAGIAGGPVREDRASSANFSRPAGVPHRSVVVDPRPGPSLETPGPTKLSVAECAAVRAQITSSRSGPRPWSRPPLLPVFPAALATLAATPATGARGASVGAVPAALLPVHPAGSARLAAAPAPMPAADSGSWSLARAARLPVHPAACARLAAASVADPEVAVDRDDRAVLPTGEGAPCAGRKATTSGSPAVAPVDDCAAARSSRAARPPEAGAGTRPATRESPREPANGEAEGGREAVLPAPESATERDLVASPRSRPEEAGCAPRGVPSSDGADRETTAAPKPPEASEASPTAADPPSGDAGDGGGAEEPAGRARSGATPRVAEATRAPERVEVAKEAAGTAGLASWQLRPEEVSIGALAAWAGREGALREEELSAWLERVRRRVARGDLAALAEGHFGAADEGTLAQARALIGPAPPQVWFALAAWASESGHLDEWSRGFVYDVGRLLGYDWKLTPRQAFLVARTLCRAVAAGFRA